MLNLKTSIANLPRITPKYAKALKKLNIITVKDLLRHFPFRFDDYSKILKIKDLFRSDTATIEGEITKSRTTRTWKRKMYLTEINLEDDTGNIKAVWFNQPYLAEQLVEGKKIRISGTASGDKSGLFFSNPAWELASRTPTNTGRLVPIYPETEGVTSRWLRWQIQMLLEKIRITELIPEQILKKLNLPGIGQALKNIHFPNSMNQAIVARKRFAFEEMFLVQLKSLQIRNSWQKERAVKVEFDENLIKKFVNSLPFKLTNAQRKSSFEILKDLEKERPMNRLLNGDVGSGKTAVAAIAALQTIKAGYQVALMAPTEVLARQHFNTLYGLFDKHNINIGLLTSSYKLIQNSSKFNSISRNKLLADIKSGQIELVIGTHALIQEDIRFKKLALVVVDEQHRFGVAQRAYLQGKASEISDGVKDKIPHFLTMTATPIPRTLALAFFGNLDISLLDEMPKERKKIITEITSPAQRNKVYGFIRQEIKNGRQVFVILPLVEESKVLTEVKAATKEYDRLSKEVFSDLKLGLVHGRLKSAEKEKAMSDFAGKKINILVATPVVEVGIDIPNATVMIIEDSDRFGLSQLHQFRGRIGRGKHQSYCYLFTSSNSATAKKRLKALVESENGFVIAQKDLELRGPGEFFGTRQSGLPDIAMENLANVKLIQIARQEAENIFKTDPGLKNNPRVRESLRKFSQTIHLE